MNTERIASSQDVDGYQVVEVVRDYPFHTARLGFDVYLDGKRLPLTRYTSLAMAENCIAAGVVGAALGA